MSTTTPAPHALTTPFVPPQGCEDHFFTTSFVSSYYWNSYAATTVTVLASAPVDPLFSSCQPSGWDKGASSFHFSPAVCPSGWTAYNLGATSLSGVSVTTSTASVTDKNLVSTAICCSSGFTYSFIRNFPISGIVSTAACYASIPTKPTTTPAPSSSSINGQDPFPHGLRVHNAWQISWEASDVSTLSPTPPQIPCTQLVLSSWLPGETIAPSVLSTACAPVSSSNNDGTSHMSASEVKGIWFLAVGLPIIVLLLVATCLGLWCRKKMRKRKAAKAKVGESQKAINPVLVEGK